jgi:hypothetical protein
VIQIFLVKRGGSDRVEALIDILQVEFDAVSLALPKGITDAELTERRLKPVDSTPASASSKPLPDWPAIHEQLPCKGVTLQWLRREYHQAHPEGSQRSRFCRLYRDWAKTLDAVLAIGANAAPLVVWPCNVAIKWRRRAQCGSCEPSKRMLRSSRPSARAQFSFPGQTRSLLSSETGMRLGDIAQLEWTAFDKEGHVQFKSDKRNSLLTGFRTCVRHGSCATPQLDSDSGDRPARLPPLP